VTLAGDLRIAEAASALAKWISWNTVPFVTLSSESHLRTSPAGTALVRIGDPAVPALQKILEKGYTVERWRTTYALNIISSPIANEALREHAPSEPDESLAAFIRKVVSKKK
jgi:hypothetical protein